MSDLFANGTADAFVAIVNGASARFDGRTTIAQMLHARDLVGRRIAVEVNGAIVPRSAHASTLLAADDRVEIVVAVGGG